MFNKIHFINCALLLLGHTFFPRISCALPSMPVVSRDQVIIEEMDCITEKLEEKSGIVWDDICFTKNARSNRIKKRDALVQRSLDMIESRLRRDAQREEAKEQVIMFNQDKKSQTKREHVSKQSFKLHYEAPKDSDFHWRVNLKAMSGYRHDDIKWSIAGTIDGTSPNIISELSWDHLQMIQYKVIGEIIIEDNLVIDGMAAYGDIDRGRNQDSDYAGDNRTLEFSRSNNQADDGEVMDFSAGLGYRMNISEFHDIWKEDSLWLTILGGYSYHEQNLIIINGVQTIPPSGPLPPELHSSYWSEWEGPWLGFSLSGRTKKIEGFFRFEYHMADFYASANWNLRSDFQHPKSFEQEAEGYGLVYGVGLNYHVNDFWSIDFNADLQNWHTQEGINTFFISDGSTPVQQLNRVDWDSYALMLGSTLYFP